VIAGTVFSVLTPAGRGAVAVIAIADAGAVQVVDSFFHAKNRTALAEQPIARIVYGNWRIGGEDLIVCRRDEECVEIHCHGGMQAVATIAADLASAGCEEISWQEWLARDNSCPLQVEAQIALAQAVSTRTALILLDQYHGALNRELQEIAELIASDIEAARQRLEALLATAKLGLHLTRPWQVVIAGRPNVGKSSLINALVGYQRAIVFDQPGTTRDVVSAATVIDGFPVSLSDTAGLHDTQDQLEAAGIELAKERLVQADLVIWVLDAVEVGGNLDEIMEQQIGELGFAMPAKRLVVLNKVDRVPEIVVPRGVIATSATAGRGIKELLVAISSALVPWVPERGAAVVFTDRQKNMLDVMLNAAREG
jgi:tRNA modification GTPase